MRFKSGGTFQSTCLIGQIVFKREHSKLYILNAQPIIKAFQRQISHLQQKEGFPCVVDLSLMTSKHDNPRALNHCPIPKSATRTVSYNLRSGSERTINKLRRTIREPTIFYIQIFLNLITYCILLAQLCYIFQLVYTYITCSFSIYLTARK